MAYMRGDPYIYQTDDYLNIHRDSGAHVSLDWETTEELVAMIWHRMDGSQQESAMKRAADKYGGNFGADGVRKALGLPTVIETIEGKLESKE